MNFDHFEDETDKAVRFTYLLGALFGVLILSGIVGLCLLLS